MRLRAALLTAILLPASLPGARSSTACRLGSEEIAVVDGGHLLLWPEGEVLWQPPRGELAGIACAGGTILAAVADGSATSVWRVPLEGQAGSREIARFRGRPVALLGWDGAVVALLERRGRGELAMANGAGRLPARPLGRPSTALVRSPDGEAVLVAAGDEIRTFAMPGPRTWFVYPIGRTVALLAARAGSPRLLVATEEGLLLVDLRDQPGRGTMPIQAEAATGPVLDLCWLPGEPAIAAVLRASPREVLFLDGSDLAELGRVRLEDDAAALVPDEPHAVSVVRSGRPPLRVTVADAAPPEAAPVARAETGRPAPPSPVPAVPEGANRPAPPGPRPPERPCKPRPAPRKIVEPPRASEPPAPEPPPEAPRPAPTVPMPPEVEEPPPGAIAGIIEGRADLVAQVVLVGPDDILEERARIAPRRDRAGRGWFLLRSLPHGHYRVMLFGEAGASLAARPSLAEVVLTKDGGVRADFVVTGPL